LEEILRRSKLNIAGNTISIENRFRSIITAACKVNALKAGIGITHAIKNAAIWHKEDNITETPLRFKTSPTCSWNERKKVIREMLPF
jgi:hypothetical protein